MTIFIVAHDLIFALLPGDFVSISHRKLFILDYSLVKLVINNNAKKIYEDDPEKDTTTSEGSLDKFEILPLRNS